VRPGTGLVRKYHKIPGTKERNKGKKRNGLPTFRLVYYDLDLLRENTTEAFVSVGLDIASDLSLGKKKKRNKFFEPFHSTHWGRDWELLRELRYT